MSKIYKIKTSSLFSERNLIIKFNESELYIENILDNGEKSLQIIKIKNIVNFSDFNFGNDLAFKIKEKYGNNFSIYAKKGKSTQDLLSLIRDFKKMLVDTRGDLDNLIYKNFYKSKYAVITLLALGIATLLMTILFVVKIINNIESDDYSDIHLSLIKIILVNTFYLIYYQNHRRKRK